MSEHLYAVSDLPEGHPVRMILAAALATDYQGLEFQSQAKLADIPTLAHDILVATKAAICKQQSLNFDGRTSYDERSSSLLIDRHVTYRDPITDKPTAYGRCEDSGSRAGGYDLELDIVYHRSLLHDAFGGGDRATNQLGRGLGQ